MHKPSLLLYIHGFNSSPLSHKAQVMAEYCKVHRPDIKVIVPRLPSYPSQAAEFLVQLVEKYKDTHQIGLVGSSLGGYLSTWLNHQYGFKAALVNPAVKPYELLADYLGKQVNPYTQEEYFLEEKHMEELLALQVETLHSVDDLWLLQQEGDEVLDYRQAVDKYSACKQTIEKGGDHSFVNFERYPEQIIQFLNL
ncbi:MULTISPECIES: esterase YqiA [Aliivibrio]|uniref:esterase YqiA n=1 Tax=Aliivibrio TaxID=511678 RepID=UPI0006D05F94|nr:MULTISPECIES: esterase YqiA [Aliivibrio]MBD1568597.1 esterase YqiA [Aliivibrio sp. S10_S31]MCE4936016.1 esterase YqiA [Aliivibrio fischeri]MUH98205.1 esterase YqiA [Aliivibrio fischeri]MUI64448.1 esterase YqiA [Aliivibrio fischeri]OCH31411.1 esterase YqiA [Aliivibrio fischeri]